MNHGLHSLVSHVLVSCEITYTFTKNVRTVFRWPAISEEFGVELSAIFKGEAKTTRGGSYS